MKQNNYWNNSINYNNNLKTKKLMKKKLSFLLALLMIAVTGAWADTVVLGTPDASVTTLSDANGIVTITDASGSTGIQAGSGSYKMTYDGTAYVPMKLSGSRNFTLSYKDGVTISKVTLLAMSNGDAEGTVGAGDGDATSLGTFPARNANGTCLTVDITGKTGLRGSRQFLALIVVEYSTTAPSLNATPAELTFALNPNQTSKTQSFTLSGQNLTNGTYNLTVPTVEGLTVSPTSFTVAEGKVNQEVSVTYASTSDIAKAEAQISATVDGIPATVDITYQSRATAYTQSTVSAEATWDWSQLSEETKLTEETSPNASEEFLLADLDDRITFNEAFGDPTAIKMEAMQYPSRGGYAQGTYIKFKTSVAGTISVEFSNTGGGNDRPDRYLNVNGENTEFKSNSTTKVTSTGIAVPAGEVVLMGNEVNNEATNGFKPNMLRWYKITFTPGEEPVEPQPHDPVTLTWSYDEENLIPSAGPDNGLYYAGYVNDAAGTNNGMHGVKLNSSGYAFFEKPAVAGTLTLTFGNRKTADAYAVNVYACTVTDGTATKGNLIGEVSVAESPGTGSIELSADVTGIYIERKTGSEGVLQKIVFKEKVPRTFVDFEITNDELKGTIADMNLPQGVTLTGTQPEAGNNAHGYINASISVPTDGGAVKFTFGGCQYANKSFTVTNSNNETIATLSNKTTNCYHQDASVVTYFYTGEATTLTFSTIPYLPYFKAEATDVQEVTVTFKDQNGNVLGTTTVFEGEALGEVPYTEADLTIPSGQKFRGWTYTNGVKVKATDVVDGPKSVIASVTAIETTPEVGSVQTYDLTKQTFYPEDHENFNVTDGKYYNNHGFDFAAGGSFDVAVGGNAQVVLALCEYGNGTTVTVTDAQGKTVASDVTAKAESGKDGATTTINYEGAATTLTFTFATQTYLHSVKVFNVNSFVEQDAESGYYIVPAGDAAALVLAINAAASTPNSKIFLPNGTYDLGETVLTGISGTNVSIIGESMEGVIIKNAPPTSMEGLEKADLFINTSTGLYMQDLTLQNALDYYNAGSNGRAVTLHDKGTQTINKNVRHLSYQDTYYSHKVGGLFYFEGGEIHGTVDFMCGNGKAYFNEVTIVTEKRSSATISANSELYVFNNCTVKNNADKYNFGRAWSDNPVCVWLNTTLEDGGEKLEATRWNLTGINCDYSIAGEYGTKDAEGTDITPESNNVTFKKFNTSMNTILDASAIDTYSIENVLGSWAATAQEQATQVEAPTATLEDGTIKWEAVSGATAYAIFKDGELLTIVGSEATSYTIEESTSGAPSLEGDTATPVYTLRAANERGGFGEPKEVTVADGINRLNIDQNGDVKIYDLNGRRIMTPTTGVYIVNGKKVVIK